MTFVGVLAAVFLLTIGPSAIDGKYVEGVVDTSKDMEFLGRFVFEPDELGQLWYEFKYPIDYCCYQMLLFNDEDSQWPYVRKHEDVLTCNEKKDQIPSNYNGKVTLNTPYNCKNKTENGQQLLVCSGTRHFTTKHPRWWFINVANCNHRSPTEGIHMQYKLNMTNGIDPMDKHFSADERYTLQTSIAFAVLYFLIALTGIYYKHQLAKKRLLHSTYQLFFASVCLQLAALIVIISALGSFALDGVEMPALKTLGHVISSLGDVLFVLMLMLVAKGYTITRKVTLKGSLSPRVPAQALGRISTTGSVKLAIFITLYALGFVFLYSYEQSAFDPRDVMFIYDSPAGLGLIILRIIGIIWLYYCVYFTIKHFTEKIKFYVLFMVCFAVWFAAEPIMIGIANEFIPMYTRAKIVNGVYWTTTFLGHMIFLVLTRPDRTNEYFPFHIKTNQVAAMVIKDDETPSDFVNPFIGAPLTRSLTNIFVNTPRTPTPMPMPIVTVSVPPQTYSMSGPRPPKINNFVSASLHAISSTNLTQDVEAGPQQQPQVQAPKRTDFSMFCVEKPAAQPDTMVKTENELSPAHGPSPPKAKKCKKASGTVAPAGAFTETNNIKELKQQVSTDFDFVEIPLDDLTITDLV